MQDEEELIGLPLLHRRYSPFSHLLQLLWLSADGVNELLSVYFQLPTLIFKPSVPMKTICITLVSGGHYVGSINPVATGTVL